MSDCLSETKEEKRNEKISVHFKLLFVRSKKDLVRASSLHLPLNVHHTKTLMPRLIDEEKAVL